MARDARRDAVYYQGTSDNLTVARHWVRENLYGAGAVCPCCGRLARIYRRSMGPHVAASLCSIYRAFSEHPENDWVNVPELLRGSRLGSGGDYAKGLLWGLIESRPEQQGPTVGWYRLTEAGVGFVLGEVGVPEHIWVYEGEVQGHEDSIVSVFDALGGQYDYFELTGRRRSG